MGMSILTPKRSFQASNLKADPGPDSNGTTSSQPRHVLSIGLNPGHMNRVWHVEADSPNNIRAQ